MHVINRDMTLTKAPPIVMLFYNRKIPVPLGPLL